MREKKIIGRPREYDDELEKILDLRRVGYTYREIEHLTKISKATAQRMVARAKKP